MDAPAPCDGKAKLLILDAAPEHLNWLTELLSAADYISLAALVTDLLAVPVLLASCQLILVGSSSPERAYELCQHLQPLAADYETPIVLIAEDPGSLDLSLTLAVGGADCLTTAMPAAEIRHRLNHQIVLQAARSEVRRLTIALAAQAERHIAQQQAIDQELRSLAYAISHDLRAPIRHIQGFTSALRQHLETHQSLTDEKTEHYLSRVEGGARKLGQMVDGMLQLTRINRQELRRQPVDLNQLVASVIEIGQAGNTSDTGNRERTPLAGATFHVGQLPTVLADRPLLHQIFIELLDNAVKFRDNSRHIQVEVGISLKGDFFVKDNGIGFAAAHPDQLFTPFQRFHSSQTFAGIGLGLALVQRIVHRHKGTLWVDSQISQGTTVYFTLGGE